METKKNLTVTIKTNEESPEPVELIAQSIIDISDAFEKIQKSRLSERALLILIKDACGVSLHDIKIVLNTVPKLKHLFLKQATGKK